MGNGRKRQLLRQEFAIGCGVRLILIGYNFRLIDSNLNSDYLTDSFNAL